MSERELRRAVRFTVELSATVVVSRYVRPALVKNFSRTGCCLEGDLGAETGNEVAVRIGVLLVMATVAWANGNLTGVSFHREIDPLQVIRNASTSPVLNPGRKAPAPIQLGSHA